MTALQEEPTASTMVPLADLGTYPLHMMANAFAFDHYCHLYVDILAPEGPLTIEVDPGNDEMIRPGIEWMIQLSSARFIDLQGLSPISL